MCVRRPLGPLAFRNGDRRTQLYLGECLALSSLKALFIRDPQGLSTLRLEWSAGLDGLEAADSLKIYKNLPRLASSLHTLSLDGDYYQDVKLVLCHEFPHLKRLSLQRFKSDESDYVIAFLARHAQLESLSLLDCPGHWLSCEFDESRFLPNLKHLKVRPPPPAHSCPPH
jgi:hypothetical protein